MIALTTEECATTATVFSVARVALLANLLQSFSSAALEFWKRLRLAAPVFIHHLTDKKFFSFTSNLSAIPGSRASGRLCFEDALQTEVKKRCLSNFQVWEKFVGASMQEDNG